MQMRYGYSINRTRGFTLLEMLIAVSIVSILSAIVVGGINVMSRNQQLGTSTDRVISTLNLARNLAISHNAIYHVRLQNFFMDEGKPNRKQAIGVYCYPRANDALSVQQLDRATGQPLASAEYHWSNRGKLDGIKRDYQVAYVPLEIGTYFGIQPALMDGAAARIVPDDSILYFLPDGTASSSMVLFVTNDPAMSDDPKESNWIWKDRNDIRRAFYNRVLNSYVAPPPPSDAPLTVSGKNNVTPQSGIHMIQVFQGGMIRFIPQEPLP